jgi:hypothetical protein
MTKKPNGFDPTRDPSKKFKYGYGMHPDLSSKPKPKFVPADLVDPARVQDPELMEIKRSLKLDLERFSE